MFVHHVLQILLEVIVFKLANFFSDVWWQRIKLVQYCVVSCQVKNHALDPSNEPWPIFCQFFDFFCCFLQFDIENRS
jgi:hypothetical protein